MNCWKTILKNNFTKIDALLDFLEFDSVNREKIPNRSRFVLSLPVRLAEKIEKNNPSDPLFLQFVPQELENEKNPLFVMDPVGDFAVQKTPMMLHKYHGRALLVLTSACAMHCRYCFRQNYPYETVRGLAKEIAAIQEDSTLSEVILSGGDPLSLPNSQLKELLGQLSGIPHVKHIRFHSRFPIGIPERIDQEFIEIISALPQQVWFVIHSNHPREFDADVQLALRKLRDAKVLLLNQSVLLKGVNDHPKTLIELSELLTLQGIIPYYLHQLDRVQGAAHFEVPENQGLELIKAMQACLPGYAVPKYVREIPGSTSKTPLF